MRKVFIDFPQHPAKAADLLPSTIRGAKMPTKILNIDWLEFTAVRKKSIESSFLFTATESDKLRSRLFKRVWEIYHIDDPANRFATFSSDAHVSFIDKNILICKIENRFLYHKKRDEYIQFLLSEFGLDFKHWGRVDISLDFQRFDNAELSIKDFLHSVATCEFVKCGQRNMRPFTELSDSFVTEDGQLFYSGRNVNAVSFGSRKSELYTVMYNKSKEMRSIKNKPYISETWEHHGFSPDLDTYRIEFSLKPKKGMVDFETAEVVDHKSLDFISNENIDKLFTTLFSKKFCFAKVEEGVRFSRLEKVHLFDLEDYKCDLLDTCDKQDSTNYTKGLINMMYKRIASFTFQDKEEIGQIEYYLSETLYKYHLTCWFRRKYPEYDLKEYVVPLGQQSILFPENYN